MYEKNIVGRYNKEDEYPTFKTDEKGRRESISAVGRATGVGAISAISGFGNRVDGLAAWRYMSELYRDRRLAKERAQHKFELPPSPPEPNQTFQENYEKDMTEFSEPDHYSPLLSQLKAHLKQVNLSVPEDLLVESGPLPFEKPALLDDVLRVRDVMAHPVTSVVDSTTIEQVASILNRKHISGVPVVHYRSRHPLGVITLSDIIRRLFEEKVLSTFEVDGDVLRQQALSVLERPVREFMSHKLVAVGPEASVKEACYLMDHNHVKRILILEHDLVVGIFSSSDAVRVLAQSELLYTPRE